MPKISLSLTKTTLVIRIDSYVHLFIRGKILGIKSYIKEAEHRNKHYIRFKTKNANFRTEYESKDLWLKVLGLLDKKMIK